MTGHFLEKFRRKRKRLKTKPEGSGDGVGTVDPAVQVEHLVRYVLFKTMCKQTIHCPNKASSFEDNTVSETFKHTKDVQIYLSYLGFLTSVLLGLMIYV